MQENGQRATSAATGPAFTVLGAACALVPSLLMWGFTVDDALIPVRYAHNLVTGAGYRFDAAGPSTDGVTPLPWAFVVAPLAGGDPMTALVRMKVLGIVAWAIGGGALGARVGALVAGERGAVRVLAALALVVMAVAFPLGAWAASGMETGLATALATVAATRLDLRVRGALPLAHPASVPRAVHVDRSRPWQVALLAGLAASLRPELVVWAVTLGAGAMMLTDQARVARGVALASLAAAPFVACAVVRGIAFGRLAPLAVIAKPSDVSHGVVYVAAATLVVLTPLCAFGPLTLVRGRRVGAARVLVAAFLAHVLSVTAAGGDWMPYARLMVPVAPSLVLGFVVLAREARPAWSGARLAAALVVGVLVAVRAAPAGRSVQADRAELVVRARPVLAEAAAVAALDVGWVSASTNARIVDLAGLTDPTIALLPGGHTSKRVDTSMLLDRGVDTVIVYSDLRAVEARLVRTELFESRFEARERLPLGTRGAFYTVYRRR